MDESDESLEEPWLDNRLYGSPPRFWDDLRFRRLWELSGPQHWQMARAQRNQRELIVPMETRSFVGATHQLWLFARRVMGEIQTSDGFDAFLDRVYDQLPNEAVEQFLRRSQRSFDYESAAEVVAQGFGLGFSDADLLFRFAERRSIWREGLQTTAWLNEQFMQVRLRSVRTHYLKEQLARIIGDSVPGKWVRRFRWLRRGRIERFRTESLQLAALYLRQGLSPEEAAVVLWRFWPWQLWVRKQRKR